MIYCQKVESKNQLTWLEKWPFQVADQYVTQSDLVFPLSPYDVILTQSFVIWPTAILGFQNMI